jgi:hypothetical protein
MGAVFKTLSLCVLSLGFFLSASLTADGATRSCRDAFTHVYKHKYVAGNCADNVHAFLGKLREAGIEPSEVKVIFFKDPFPPKHYRTAASHVGWEWHAIAVKDGLVYDFDYAGVKGTDTPEVLTVQQYIDKNLGGINSSTSRIRMREINGQFFYNFWMKPVMLDDGRGQRVRTVDSAYMMHANLHGAGADNTLGNWAGPR